MIGFFDTPYHGLGLTYDTIEHSAGGSLEAGINCGHATDIQAPE